MYLHSSVLLLQALPSLDDWLESMHQQPLIKQQTGGPAHATEFNVKLAQELKLINAKDLDYTLHGARNDCIAMAKEDYSMRADSVQIGAGHAKGSHVESYKG